MRFRSDSQRRAVFANMNRFSNGQINPYAAAAATATTLDYPAAFTRFAMDPVSSYDVGRTSAGVPFKFPVNTKKYYDGRIYVYPGEAYTLKEALSEQSRVMNIEDGAKAKLIAEDLGAEISKHQLEGKESEGMIFLNDDKLNFLEKVFGVEKEFSMDPIEAEAIVKDVKYWADMDKDSSPGKPKPDKKHINALKFDTRMKRVLEKQAAVPVQEAVQEDEISYEI